MSVINLYRKIQVTPMSDKSPLLLYFTSSIKKLKKKSRKSSTSDSIESFRRREKRKRCRFFEYSPRTPLYKRCKLIKKRLNFDDPQDSTNVNVDKGSVAQTDQVVPKILFSLYDNDTLINSNENDSELYVQYTESKAEQPATPNIHQLTKNVTPLKNNKLFNCGRFGWVAMTIYKAKMVAVKLIKNHKNICKSSLRSELNGIGLNHPNILKIETIAWTKYNFDHQYNIVIMECFYESKNLLNLINNSHFIIDIQQIINFTIDICRGLQYLHSKGILHLSLRPKNILVFQSGLCKLFDFGSSVLSCEKIDDDIMRKFKGSIQYCSPELLLGQHLTTAADIYSLSITMWQIIHRLAPYGYKMKEEIIAYRVVRNCLRPSILQSLIISYPLKTYKNIFVNCWQHEPSVRFTIDRILMQLESIKRSMYSFNITV